MKRQSAMEALQDDSDERDLDEVMHLRPRRVTAEQLRKYEEYIAHEHIIGISKLTRLVRLFAKRFTVQERLGQQMADTLEAMLEPHGVAIYLEAHHLCTQMRGVRESAPLTRTSVWRGAFASNPTLRSEFLTISGIRS